MKDILFVGLVVSVFCMILFGLGQSLGMGSFF